MFCCAVARNRAALHCKFGIAFNIHATAKCVREAVINFFSRAAGDYAARNGSVGARRLVGNSPKAGCYIFSIIMRALRAVTVAQRKVCIAVYCNYRAIARAREHMAV